MKNVLLNSVDNYVDELEKYSGKVGIHYDEEDIHRFRTTAKKMRSLLRWQEVKPKKLPGSFMKIYHISGDLRNLQLLLVNYNEQKIILPRFMLWLATSIGRLQQDWKSHYQKAIMKKLRHHLHPAELAGLSGIKLEAFFGERMALLKQMQQLPNPPDEQLHEIRKIIKDLYYTRQWCKKNWTPGFTATSKFKIQQLDKLSDLAGDYNDRSMGLLILADYLREEKDSKAGKAARRVQATLTRQKKSLKRELVRAVKNFSNQSA